MIDLIKISLLVIVSITVGIFIVVIIYTLIVGDVEMNRQYERERLQRNIRRLERELGLVELDKPRQVVYPTFDELLARDVELLQRFYGSRNSDATNDRLIQTERK